MVGNSGAPLEHLVHPAVCSTLGFGAKRLHVLEPTFFANGAEVGGVRERALGSPTHPLARWPTAAPGGEKREGGALHRPYGVLWSGELQLQGLQGLICMKWRLLSQKSEAPDRKGKGAGQMR
jgi:hypothetical protein